MTLSDRASQTSRQLSPVDISTQTSRQLSPIGRRYVDMETQVGKNLNWNPANNWKYMALGAALLGGGYGAYKTIGMRKSQNARLVPISKAPKDYYGPDTRYNEPGNYSNLTRYYNKIHTPTPTPSLEPVKNKTPTYVWHTPTPSPTVDDEEPSFHSDLSRYQLPTPTPMEVTGTNPMNDVDMAGR